jgi:hypothetical protein
VVFAIERSLAPFIAAWVRCTYHEKANASTSSELISYKLKVAARRYFSEARDNYVSRNEFLHRSAAIAKRLLK